MSPEFRPIIGPDVDYYAAREEAETLKSSVCLVQERHQKEHVIALAPTPALEKLNAKAAKLQSELDQVEAARLEAAGVIDTWNGMIAERDRLAEKLKHTRQQHEIIEGDIPGRIGFIQEQCVGGDERHFRSVSQLCNNVAGLQMASRMFKDAIPEQEKAMETLQTEIAAFAKTHGIRS